MDRKGRAVREVKLNPAEIAAALGHQNGSGILSEISQSSLVLGHPDIYFLRRKLLRLAPAGGRFFIGILASGRRRRSLRSSAGLIGHAGPGLAVRRPGGLAVPGRLRTAGFPGRLRTAAVPGRLPVPPGRGRIPAVIRQRIAAVVRRIAAVIRRIASVIRRIAAVVRRVAAVVRRIAVPAIFRIIRIAGLRVVRGHRSLRDPVAGRQTAIAYVAAGRQPQKRQYQG
jgi:hypothetical protein